MTRNPAGRRKRSVAAAVVLVLLAAGCGRYDGTVRSKDYAHASDGNESHEGILLARSTEVAGRMVTMTLVVRDILPLDIFDASCRLVDRGGPPKRLMIGSWARGGGILFQAFYEMPRRAKRVQIGCEAPGVVVHVPYQDEYVAFVPLPHMGIARSARDTYPRAFPASDQETVYIPE